MWRGATVYRRTDLRRVDAYLYGAIAADVPNLPRFERFRKQASSNSVTQQATMSPIRLREILANHLQRHRAVKSVTGVGGYRTGAAEGDVIDRITDLHARGFENYNDPLTDKFHCS